MKATRLTTVEFDFGIDAPPLLDQMDTQFDVGDMAAGAMHAAALFSWAEDQTAVAQAELAGKLSIAALRNVVPNDIKSVAVAVGAAALLMAAKAGPATASERISRAAKLLSDRYQSDW